MYSCHCTSGSSGQHLPLALVRIASVAAVNVTATSTTMSVAIDNVAFVLQPSLPSLEPVRTSVHDEVVTTLSSWSCGAWDHVAINFSMFLVGTRNMVTGLPCFGNRSSCVHKEVLQQFAGLGSVQHLYTWKNDGAGSIEDSHTE